MIDIERLFGNRDTSISKLPYDSKKVESLTMQLVRLSSQCDRTKDEIARAELHKAIDIISTSLQNELKFTHIVEGVSDESMRLRKLFGVKANG